MGLGLRHHEHVDTDGVERPGGHGQLLPAAGTKEGVHLPLSPARIGNHVDPLGRSLSMRDRERNSLQRRRKAIHFVIAQRAGSKHAGRGKFLDTGEILPIGGHWRRPAAAGKM